MSVGAVVPFINDFLVINGDASTTIGGPVPEGRTKVVVLEFWATWCGPCLQSIPHLSELQRKYKDVDVTIVGSTNEQDEQKIRDFVKNQSMDYTVVLDKNQSLHSKVFKPSGATGIPFAAVIVNNKIVFSGHPMDPLFGNSLEQAAAKASSTRKEPVALPLITQSYEELMQLRPKELRQILDDRGIRTTGCSEKGDFAKLIVETCARTQYYKQE
ncbi:thioredoxin-like protein [Dissophora ornata]|nr:thioredoxin-like protein [Dissophora ornata]